MIFSYNWLKGFVSKLPRPEKLAELLTMHSFEVKELSSKGKDWAIDIDVLSNRGPDCFSHIGMAREIAAITNSKFKNVGAKLQNKGAKLQDIAIEIKDRNDCPRYTAQVITDVKVGPSPKLIQERLKVCGLRPINNIVDAANYVMLETGQPLHAFDLDKIEGAKLLVRRAKRGEKITSLDGGKYNLDKDILVITDSKEPLAIAGIKGGKKAEIDKKTKTIVLESANFNPRVVRQGSQKLGLKTDASWRFEHGIDPNLTELAINRGAKLIQGKLASGLIDFYPQRTKLLKIKLDLNYVEKLLGVKISKPEIKNILQRLGFKIEELSSSKELSSLIIEVPSWRLDISLAEDLIEEIGRLYGYEKIPATFPVVSLIPPKRNLEIFWEDSAKDILKELGFTEVYNYSFIGEKGAKLLKGAKLFEVANPMSSEQKYLRPSLIPNLLKNIEDNLRYFKEIKIFELGKIFGQEEKQALAGASTNDFYYIKGAVDALLNKLGISDIYYDEYKPESVWTQGRCAEIKIGGEKIGCLGEAFGINMFEIDFEKLRKLCSEEHEYQPISQYPAAIRDLAVLVPIDVKVVDVLNKINTAGGPLVRDVDLFDIYEGEELPEGKKNLAFHIIYQAKDRTLTSKEIDKIQNKIINILEENPEWQVRK